MESPSVATYPTTGVRAKSQMSVFQKEKCVGVATNVYLRENVRKTKKRYANLENKGAGVVYA